MADPENQGLLAQDARYGDGADRENIPAGIDTAGRHLLLPQDSEGGHVTRPAAPRTRRRAGWSFACLSIVSVASIFILAGLLLSLDLIKAETESQADEHSKSRPYRSNNDYILDPDWNFFAPSQVREYEWTITDSEGSPDGVRKPMMLINNQFPGPLIEMNEGDTLVVKLTNKASNATALHWHGIFQNGTNWMDGAAGITQCPIVPGRSFEYRFTVTGQSGTYFYHGHQGVQALDGLVGPMVVHNHREAGRSRLPYSSDRVILLQDWWYDPGSGLLRDVLSPGVEDAPVPNTALLNGVNRAVCADHPNRKCTEVKAKSLPRVDVVRGDSHRFRFINLGGYAWFQVAIDDHHDLQVIEVDGTVVEPALKSQLLIAPGQRYSAIMKADADHDEGSYWLRARMLTSCFAEQKLPENGIDEAKAIIRYTKRLGRRHGGHGEEDEGEEDMEEHEEEEEEEGEKENIVLPQSTSELTFLSTCRDLSSNTTFLPSPKQPAPRVADHSWHLRVNLAIGDWRLQRGVVNASSFRPNLKYPTLHRVLDGLENNNSLYALEGINTAAFDKKSELVISANQVETVDLILQNMDENNHPFHLHGAKMWVLGAGHAYFPGYEALGLNPRGRGLLDRANDTVIRNPLKRDTVTVEGYGWALLRFVADNPGVWLFHCHVIWHSEAGMGMQFLSRIDELRGLQLPEDARNLCNAPEAELRKGAPPKDEIFFGLEND